MARSTPAAPQDTEARSVDRPAAPGRESANEPASYEQAIAELDHLVEQMEHGELPLDRLLDDYRRGAELLAFCRGRLEAVEAQVKLLEEGRLKPWTGG